MVRPITATVWALSLAVWLAACGGLPGAQRGPGAGERGPKPAPQFKPGFNLFSPQQDVEIGRQNAAQIERQMRLLPEPQIQRYISALGQRLAAQAPGEKFPYQFRVVDVREVNAFALPGGFLYVNRGTIEAARNEAELAGVMAHEISHAALRHGTNQVSKQYVAQKGLGIAVAILGREDNSGLSDAIGSMGGLGLNLVFLRFGRTAEKQADLTGAEIMTAAGYDPRAMASFFQTLEQQTSQRLPQFLSDHPNPGNRVRYLNELIPSLHLSANPITNTPEFEQVRASLRGLPASTSRPLAPKQPPGIVAERPPAPSASHTTFRAPDGAFESSYPSNWQAVVGRGEHLIFAAPGAFGRIGEGIFVTHGIFVGTFELPANARNLEPATAAYIELQLRDNPELQPLSSPRPINLGGRPGLATPIGGESPVTGRAERDVIYTTLLPDGRLFYLVTIVPQDEAGIYQSAFEQMLASLRFGN
jgi:Zn-dependent protease with chaperone function